MTTTHRMSRTPTHTSWRKMRERCQNSNSAQWRWYGARGIRVCARWQTFDNFLADMGKRPKGMTIDRIDTNGHYEPENCRWATHRQQIHGQRKTIKIETDNGLVPLVQLCMEQGLSVSAVYQRMKNGETFDSAKVRRRKKSDQSLREFGRLRNLGLSNRDCAAVFGMTEGGIGKWSAEGRKRGYIDASICPRYRSRIFVGDVA